MIGWGFGRLGGRGWHSIAVAFSTAAGVASFSGGLRDAFMSRCISRMDRSLTLCLLCLYFAVTVGDDQQGFELHCRVLVPHFRSDRARSSSENAEFPNRFFYYEYCKTQSSRSVAHLQRRLLPLRLVIILHVPHEFALFRGPGSDAFG